MNTNRIWFAILIVQLLLTCARSYNLRSTIETGSSEGISIFDEPTTVFEDNFRIVGGTNVQSGTYPYMVNAGGCGGSLIAPDMMLSAAHCFSAIGGAVRIGSIDRTSGGELANVRLKIKHPNYEGNNNDFMVVKLDREVKATPVKLNANENMPTTDDALTVIGFGRTSEGGSSSNRLKQVTVPYVNNTQCRSIYGNYIRQDTMLCAGTQEGGKDACQGDSGGPIMNSGGVQVGVVSFGSGCARPEVPGVYARTSGAIGWINEMICEHSPKFCPEAGNESSSNGGGKELETDTVELRVKVTHDEYPEEVSWFVKDSSGQVIMRQKEDDVTKLNAVVEKTSEVPPGTYLFRIDDGWGDGICCRHGKGKIEIFVDNVKVVEIEGNYASYKEHSFEIPGGQEKSVKCMIDFQYDLYPEEVSWWLKDSKGEALISRDLNSVLELSHFLSEEINLSFEEDYTLELRDGHGDGLTYKTGYVEIYTVVKGGKKIRLLYDDGDYGKGRDRPFRVPSHIFNTRSEDKQNLRDRGDATQSKPAEATCSDSDDGLFAVNEEIGKRDCKWLLGNLDHFEYLCEFVSVASKCPNTCGDCSLFNKA